ncbi:MAG: hypothetical protein Q4C43_09460 [Prevotella sp.]|nr:hypothetical protein [Prevotella sp.]MDO4933370.1 hypothetical protein [Prevotella sp.]
MNKKIVMPLAVVILLLIAGIGYLTFSLVQQKEANKEMQELADLDKKEMENEYEQFARQYSEMMTQINNDSIVEQLTQEQLRTQQLLEELKNVKSTNAREIARLKKELATVRAVLRNYVLEIDSLNRVNQTLTDENERMKSQYSEATRQIEGLSSEKASLSEKVAIAAQLDATNIRMVIKKKNGKVVKKIKDCRNIEVAFTIARNVTAPNGMKTFYVRITTPTGAVLGNGAMFPYEDRNIEYSMKKSMEYTGEELQVSTYWNVAEFLSAGNYTVSIFADGNMIGSRTFQFK